jgi:hypothetical protein
MAAQNRLHPHRHLVAGNNLLQLKLNFNQIRMIYIASDRHVELCRMLPVNGRPSTVLHQ